MDQCTLIVKKLALFAFSLVLEYDFAYSDDASDGYQIVREHALIVYQNDTSDVGDTIQATVKTGN